MREFLKSMKISFILAAVLYIVLGFILLLWPGTTTTVICYAFGAMMLVYGLITIISYFVHDSKQGSFMLELFLGIVTTALGVLFLVQPKVVASILPVILGLFLIVDSLLNLKRALELRRIGYDKWLVSLILSVVSIALGLLILFRPFMALETVMLVIGGAFIYQGVSDLWSIFKVSRQTKEYRKRHPVEVDPIDFD